MKGFDRVLWWDRDKKPKKGYPKDVDDNNFYLYLELYVKPELICK